PGVVFDRPVSRVAGKAIPAGQRGYPALFQSAEAAVGGGPERPLVIEPQVADAAFAQATGRGVRGAHLVSSAIGDSAQGESNPETTPQTIGGEGAHGAAVSQRGPRHPANDAPLDKLKEGGILVRDPEAATSVLGDGRHRAGYVDHWHEVVVIEITKGS